MTAVVIAVAAVIAGLLIAVAWGPLSWLQPGGSEEVSADDVTATAGPDPAEPVERADPSSTEPPGDGTAPVLDRDLVAQAATELVEELQDLEGYGGVRLDPSQVIVVQWVGTPPEPVAAAVSAAQDQGFRVDTAAVPYSVAELSAAAESVAQTEDPTHAGGELAAAPATDGSGITLRVTAPDSTLGGVPLAELPVLLDIEVPVVAVEQLAQIPDADADDVEQSEAPAAEPDPDARVATTSIASEHLSAMVGPIVVRGCLFVETRPGTLTVVVFERDTVEERASDGQIFIEGQPVIEGHTLHVAGATVAAADLPELHLPEACGSPQYVFHSGGAVIHEPGP